MAPPETQTNEPCPCRSGRSAGACCAPDGVVRPKAFRPRITSGLEASQVSGCYARSLSDCRPPISSEHALSATMLSQIESERGIFVRGPAWQEGKWLPVRALGSNVLCKGHNSALSEFAARIAVLGDQIMRLGDELARRDPSPWLRASLSAARSHIIREIPGVDGSSPARRRRGPAGDGQDGFGGPDLRSLAPRRFCASSTWSLVMMCGR